MNHMFLLCFFISSCFFTKNLEPFLIFERTGCYGTCPQYIITIYDDGKITYNGRFFVERVGAFESKISLDMINKIHHLIDDINFFSLDSLYRAPMTDIPSVVTIINLNKKKHRVIDQWQGPESLRKMYHLIDSITNSGLDWNILKQ